MLRIGVLDLLTFCQYLRCLLLRYAFDLFEDLLRSVCHRFDGVIPAIDEKLDISFGEACHALKVSQ